MWPDQVSNPGPLTYESGALPTALHSLARKCLLEQGYLLGLIGFFMSPFCISTQVLLYLFDKNLGKSYEVMP